MIHLIIGLVLAYLAYKYLPGTVIPVPGIRKINIEIPKEANPEWKPEKFLENPSIITKDANMIQCYDPCTGADLGRVKADSASDVIEMINKARKAQKKWSNGPNFSFETRRAILRTLQDWIVNHQLEIAQVCCRDSGKTLVDASFGEILTTLEKLRWTIEEGEACLKTEYRSSGPVTVHKSARVDYVPFGVVGCIVSWNYPFHNTFGPLISALFAGNAIVVKTSEQVAWSCKFWENIIRQALIVNDVDPELVWFATGFREAGEALVANVDKVTFIGSPNVGKMVMKHASETLTPVVLELGGKDAAVVFEDADFNQVCNIVMRGTYQNCGQNCIGLERIIIQDSIHDKFVQEMKKRVTQLRQGPTLFTKESEVVDVGAMTMSNASQHISSLIQDAVSKGATLVCGGKPFVHPDYPNGSYFAPTILDNCRPDMEICKNEVFGPVMTIYKFSTEQEAIDLANASGYGLGSCVFTNDIARGERVMAQMTTGMCNLNDFAVNYLCQSLPFGGRGISGFDRFAGIEGLRGNTVARAVTTDRIPGVKTDIPPMLNYPMKYKSMDFVEGMCSMMYENGIVGRVKGIKQLLMSMVGKAKEA